MAHDKLLAARYLLTSPASWRHARPYLAKAAAALTFVERPGLGMFGLDRYWRVYYDPDLVEAATVEELAVHIYAMILHLLLKHGERGAVYEDKPRWVRAANLAVQGLLANEGMPRLAVRLPIFPEPLPFPTPEELGFPGNLTADEYYSLLPETPWEDNPVGGNGEEAEDQGQPHRNQGNKPEQNPENPEPHQGSGVDGQSAPWEEPPPEEGQDAPPGVHPSEAELIRRQVAQAARQAGDVPGWLRRWAEEVLEPQVDWRRELHLSIQRALLSQYGPDDYTYARPSRIQPPGGVILPGMAKKKPPEVAVVVDTSGSIADRELAQILGEVKGILNAVGGPVHVLAVDAAVHSVKRVFRPDQVELVGGGGTDMGAGIRAAADLKPRPNVVIVLTDGYTPWPKKPPEGMKVVVGLLDDTPPPQWAKSVRIRR